MAGIVKSCYCLHINRGSIGTWNTVADWSKSFLFHMEGINWFIHLTYALLLREERAETQAGSGKEELCGTVLVWSVYSLMGMCGSLWVQRKVEEAIKYVPSYQSLPCSLETESFFEPGCFYLIFKARLGDNKLQQSPIFTWLSAWIKVCAYYQTCFKKTSLLYFFDIIFPFFPSKCSNMALLILSNSWPLFFIILLHIYSYKHISS